MGRSSKRKRLFPSKTFLTFPSIQNVMAMKKFLGFVIVFILFTQVFTLMSNAGSKDHETEWNEFFEIGGSCGSDNVRTHFTVNRTVVEIMINLTWTTEGGGADLDMWVEHAESYVVNASDSEMMPEVMNIRKFPNRGRWTLVVVPISCGSSGMANFTANITLRNIILPNFRISSYEIEVGENVTMSMNSSSENVSRYMFDFGDRTDSGWIFESSITKKYETKGDYYPSAKVQYSDGTESDWVEAGLIEVIEEEEIINFFLVALISMIVFFLIAFIMLLIIKKKKMSLREKK